MSARGLGVQARRLPCNTIDYCELGMQRRWVGWITEPEVYGTDCCVY